MRGGDQHSQLRSLLLYELNLEKISQEHLNTFDLKRLTCLCVHDCDLVGAFLLYLKKCLLKPLAKPPRLVSFELVTDDTLEDDEVHMLSGAMEACSGTTSLTLSFLRAIGADPHLPWAGILKHADTLTDLELEAFTLNIVDGDIIAMDPISCIAAELPKRLAVSLPPLSMPLSLTFPKSSEVTCLQNLANLP